MKIEVKLLTDVETIVGLLAKGNLLDSISDDLHPKKEDLPALVAVPIFKYMGVYVDDRLVGIWMMNQLTSVMWQVHVAYDPEVWGTEIPRATGKIARDGAFDLTGGSKLYASVPCTYKPAVGFAKSIGMKIEGTCKRGWKKNGEILDMYHMGVYR